MSIRAARERFSATVENYRRHRPDYPSGMVDWIVSVADASPGARVLDVGAGTGISALHFRERGFDVLATDANGDMLARAREEGLNCVRCSAEDLAVADATADLVTCGQAMHWFDMDRALDEFSRVLIDDGHVAVFWNVRADTPFLQEYDLLLRQYSQEYERVPRPDTALRRLRDHERVADLRETEFSHAQNLDLEGFLGRVRSSSFVVHGVMQRSLFEDDLVEVFERFAHDGRVDFDYTVPAAVFRVT